MKKQTTAFKDRNKEEILEIHMQPVDKMELNKRTLCCGEKTPVSCVSVSQKCCDSCNWQDWDAPF